jgi:hypothetical protein
MKNKKIHKIYSNVFHLKLNLVGGNQPITMKLCLSLLLTLFFVQGLFASIHTLRCGSTNALNMEETLEDEIVVLEEVQNLFDDCKDKFVCQLECSALDAKYKNCILSKPHYDLTDYIKTNQIPPNYQNNGIIGYVFPDNKKTNGVDTEILNSYFDGSRHFVVPKHLSTVKLRQKLESKNFKRETFIGYILRPKKVEELSKGFPGVNFKSLFLHYTIPEEESLGAHQMDKIFRIEISNMETPDRSVFKESLFLGYVPRTPLADTIPVTLFKNKENDLILESPIVEKETGIMGWNGELYLDVCFKAKRSSRVKFDNLDAYFRSIISEHYQVNENAAMIKNRGISVAFDWAKTQYEKMLKSQNKSLTEQDLEYDALYSRILTYIGILSQFPKECELENFSRRQLKTRFRDYMHSTAIANRLNVYVVKNPKLWRDHQKEINSKFFDSVQSGDRSRFCQCSNFVNVDDNRLKNQRDVLRNIFLQHCEAECPK